MVDVEAPWRRMKSERLSSTESANNNNQILKSRSGKPAVFTLLLMFCAATVALMNVYMNIIAHQSVPHMQLDMSAHGDALAFHQVDVHDRQYETFVRKSSNTNKEQSKRAHNKEPPPLYMLGGERSVMNTTCAGLCPPKDWMGSQLDYISTILERYKTSASKRKRPDRPIESAMYRNTDQPKLSKHELQGLWSQMSSWTDARHVVRADVADADLDAVKNAMRQAKATRAYLTKTNELIVELEGGLTTVVNFIDPKSVAKPPAAFMLGRLLRLNRYPFSVSRHFNVAHDLTSVGDEHFNQSISVEHGRTCFQYGDTQACSLSNSNVIEATLTPWLTFSHVQPLHWVYAGDAHHNANQCVMLRSHKLFGNAPLYADMVETGILDYLTGYVRRRVTHLFTGVDPPMLLLFAGYKTAFSSNDSFLTTLAPLYQCCQFRREIYSQLVLYSERALCDEINQRIQPLSMLNDDECRALNRRVTNVLRLMQACIDTHGNQYSFIRDHF